METARPGQRVFSSAANYGNVRQEKTKLDINFNALARRWHLTKRSYFFYLPLPAPRSSLPYLFRFWLPYLLPLLDAASRCRFAGPNHPTV
jgi:hypothetical protein